MMGSYGMWPGFPWMWIFPFLFLIVIFVFMSIFFRRGPGCGGRDHDCTPHETPRQILDRRYASGEISKEEYETIKHDLDR